LKRFILCIFIASLSTSIAFSFDKNGLPEEYSREYLISFTRSLIGSKEYFRALHELKRTGSYYKNYFSPLEFFITRNYLLYMGGQYKEMNFVLDLPGDEIAGLAGRLYKIDTSLRLMDYRAARLMMPPDTAIGDPHLEKIFFKRRLFTHIMMDRLDNRREAGALSDFADFRMYHELMEGARMDFETLKSPGLAAVLGIIPGMGHVYTGNTGTGIVAFIVVAINAAVSYYGFSTGNRPLGLFVGAIGTFFYGGSILGGYLSAGNYNSSVLNNIQNGLVNDLKFNEDHDYLYRRYGIGKYDKK